MTSRAAFSWMTPPSIKIKSGISACSFNKRVYRRRMTSIVSARSSACSTVLFLYLRYLFLLGTPSSKTTIADTISAPCVCEWSNASMRWISGIPNASAISCIAPLVFDSFISIKRNFSSNTIFAFFSAKSSKSRFSPRCGVRTGTCNTSEIIALSTPAGTKISFGNTAFFRL